MYALHAADKQDREGQMQTLPSTHLYGHLPHDIVRREDGLQVQPRRLHLEPVVHDVLEVIEGFLPLHDSIEKRPNVPGAIHADVCRTAAHVGVVRALTTYGYFAPVAKSLSGRIINWLLTHWSIWRPDSRHNRREPLAGLHSTTITGMPRLHTLTPRQCYGNMYSLVAEE